MKGRSFRTAFFRLRKINQMTAHQKYVNGAVCFLALPKTN